MLAKRQRRSGCRRLSAEAVPATDDHFGALFRGSRDAVLVADRTGRCIDANPAAESLLGFERDELLRLDLSDIAGGPEALEGEVGIAPFPSGDRWRGEMHVRGKDGFPRRVEAWSVEVSAPPGAAYALFLRSADECPPNDESGARLFA
ncbi:MAG: hypothetical protein K0Q89_1607, partial [Thermomicrobiales bacterium]|nr:hypothetical protein [Thermomicrobiales bacterium]